MRHGALLEGLTLCRAHLAYLEVVSDIALV
jgi:hypothetical protein